MTRKNVPVVSLFGVLLAGLLFCGTSFGADAAMVTNVTGDVKATFQQDEWTPNVAETLTAQTKLKIGPGGSITLIHLGLHKEVELTGPQEIELMNDSIKGGEGGKGTALTEISPNLDLKDQHLFEAGGVKPDNARPEVHQETMGFDAAKKSVTKGFLDEEGASELPQSLDPENKDAGEMDALTRLPRAAAPAKPEESARRKSPAGASGFAVDGNDVGVLGGAGKPKKEHETVSPTFFMAFPETFLQKQFGKPVNSLKTADGVHTFTQIPSQMTGWLVFGCASLIGSEGQKLAMTDGTKDSSMIEIDVNASLAQEPEKPLLAALVHESEGRLAQAAVLWINLSNQGKVKKAQAIQHLTRLAKKMLQ